MSFQTHRVRQDLSSFLLVNTADNVIARSGRDSYYLRGRQGEVHYDKPNKAPLVAWCTK